MPASQATGGAAARPDGEPTLATVALGTAGLARDLIGDMLGLVTAEARLAGLSLIGIVVAALVAVFVAMAFWLLLQAGLIVALARLGVDILWLLAAFTLLNGAATLLLLLAIRRLSRNLTFRATAKALRGGSEHAASAARDTP